MILSVLTSKCPIGVFPSLTDIFSQHGMEVVGCFLKFGHLSSGRRFSLYNLSDWKNWLKRKESQKHTKIIGMPILL
ncbi:hypothetical protein L1987_22105 [Smallanthus sonchifolius]|uniref:Uncharacterized protein n=1 Tax=Smallanthus sonchifolius TaxID=185202 RepID=A0ACB9IFA2_9ASTR|nr:hypothetical protein L1987_22105 [Smallanthus sonchifolius]